MSANKLTGAGVSQRATTAQPDSRTDSNVYPFSDVNQQLWHLPMTTGGETDWDAVRACLAEAPEESSSVVSRYFLSWLNPYVTLASRERLEEAYMPLPQRRHRAVYCGALLSRAFRDAEVRGGRDAWRSRVEAAEVCEDGAVRVRCVNALTGVQFRGEAGVRGRLRWTGYLRSSNAPHVLLGGVEWDGDAGLPAYRARHAGCDGEAAVHDGAVHGERLFHQVQRGGARCTLEYVSDLVPLAAGGGSGDADGAAVPVLRCATPHAPSLLVALFRTFKNEILAILGPAVIGMVCELATPWLLQQFVLFLQSNRAESGTVFGFSMFLLFCLVIMTKPLAFNKRNHRSSRLSSLFRTATFSLLFEKCFTVSPDALAQPEMSTGRILTMASSDLENIKYFPRVMMFLWMAPILLIIYLVYLFTLVGWNVLAGVAVFAISLPIQGAFARALERKQDSLSSCTDQRLRRTNELLSGIRVVKTMGWESKFLSAIEDDARTEELKSLKQVQECDICLSAVVHATPPLMVAAVLTSYTMSGHVLDASVVLPVIAVVNAVTYPIIMLPQAFSALAKFLVSTTRLTKFLECDDAHIHLTSMAGEVEATAAPSAAACFDDVTVFASVPAALPAYEPRHGWVRRSVERVRGAVLGGHVPVELQWRRAASAAADNSGAPPRASATAASNDAAPAAPAAARAGAADGSTEADDEGGDAVLYTLQDKALLRDVRVCVPRGQLTVVVGATGSGKSVLVSTLLGAFRFRGRVGVCPSIAYVPQQPWIMQETVQANITFFEGDQRGTAGSAGSAGGAALACSPLRGVRGGAVTATTTAASAVSERLSAAVRCCQLEADLALLSKGLGTEIGEKGVNLSGGQKARVSLARAVYADRDVYVLDDPLSALDAHVGRRVMEDVVLEALRDKTRVLVTHQLHVLPYADQVVVVREGCVVFAGSYDAYVASEWKAYVEHQEVEAAAATRQAPTTADNDEGAVNDFSPAGSPMAPADTTGGGDAASDVTPAPADERDVRSFHSPSPHLPTTDKNEVEVKVDESGAATHADAVGGGEGGEDALMTQEEKATGHVPWTVYGCYAEAGGGLRLACRIVGVYFLGDGLYGFTNVWLTLWSVQYFAGVLSNTTQLLIFLALTLFVQLLLFTNEFSFYGFARRASRRLHATLLYTVSSGTLTFFDRTPLGRLVNRFSKDIYTLDDEVPASLAPFVAVADAAITSLLVSVCASPPTLIVVLLACAAFVRMLKFYATVVREVRRRGSVVQSPLFSLLEEVVQGRATIAAYGKSHALFAEALRRLDSLYACTYMEQTVTLWLSIRVEYMAAFIIIVVGLIGVAEKMLDASPVMPQARVGLISLSLTMCLDLSWALSETVEFAAKVEASMSSVQRVCHYIEDVPQEALLLEPQDAYVAGALALRGGGASSAGVPPAAAAGAAAGARAGGSTRARDVTVEDDTAAAVEGVRGSGDAFGSLRLEHVDMRYRPGLPLVLRDVSFAIAPGQKVGVVGRTGSGKSTLLLAFLRLVEVCGGRMVVCGRDAQAYTLPALRRLFSMIPQDPVLFDGTIRSNVDPFGDATDAEVRRALASVGFVSGGADGAATDAAAEVPAEVPALETVVQEGGSNFSVGQRQLLCLARALLKKGSAFILMDEATANVDARLDQTVQRVVAEQFRDYTVVTIAHRLHTVAAYDMILVMAHGRVVEYGSPRSLLERRTSVFYGMVAQSSAVVGAAGVSGDVSAAEREQRVEEVIAAFLAECK